MLRSAFICGILLGMLSCQFGEFNQARADANSQSKIPPPKNPEQEAKIKAMFLSKTNGWREKSAVPAIRDFGVSRYDNRDADGTARYHVSLYFEEKKAKKEDNYYGQAMSVELDGATIRFTLPPVNGKKEAPKRRFEVKRVGDELELKILDGDLKGTYTFEQRPIRKDPPAKNPEQEARIAQFFAGVASWREKGANPTIRDFGLSRYTSRNDDGTSNYHVTLYFTDKKFEAEGYYGKAESIELTGATVRFTLPPVKDKKDAAKRSFEMKRIGDELEMKILDGALKGTYTLQMIPKK